jgi:DNA replication and repair protein RecF
VLLKALQLDGFRNLAPTTLLPSSRFNVLHGDNAQGKTNVLEAIYLVGTLRSFRTTHPQEMVRFGDASAAVKARVERGGLERSYEVRLEGARKHVRLDGKTPRSLGEYFGDFNVVLFAPEDLRVPRGSPAGRRRFLDRTVFNRHPVFLGEAQKYQRVLKSRNQVLRDARPDEALLAVYDEQLAALGSQIVARRRSLLGELGPELAIAWESITRSGLAAALEYRGGSEDLAAELAASRGRDAARKQTSVGPHVHDVEFQLDGRPARAFASQGQLRALVLAWKTAEMRLLEATLGDAPILLLDDVSSELDPSRNEYLFGFLQEIECQCFVTTTHPRHVLATANRKDFQVVAGQVHA